MRSLGISLSITAIFFLFCFLFFQSPLLPMHHITQLRLLRSFIFLWACLFLQLIFAGTQKLSIEKSPAALVLVWLLPYAYVFSHIPDYFQNDVGSYYIFPSLLYTSVWFLNRLLPKAGTFCLPLSILCAIPVWGEIISALAYGFYYYHYGQSIDEVIIMSILATTPSEAYNYLTSVFSLPLLSVLGILLLLLFFILVYGLSRMYRPPFSFPSGFGKVKTAVVLTAVLYLTGSYMTSVFPLDHIYHLYHKDGYIRAFMELKKNLPANSQTIQLHDQHEWTSRKVPGSIILVIGESANRDYMSAFSDTDVDNTPWEKAMRQNQDFFFFSRSYANFPNTVMAVTQALTSANQYNQTPLKRAVDLLTLAKKAGYTTYWISTQEKSNVSDAGITVIAKQADHRQWLKGDDECILTALEKVPDQQNNFIVLHIKGSHFRYDQRVPETYCQKHNWDIADKDEKLLWYSRSLHHTDTILRDIFQTSRNRLQLQAMVYVSDHGEDLELTHTASPFKFSMVHIPLWIYLSPAYQAAYPQTTVSLRQHEEAIFTNDLLFDMFSGLLHAPSNYYDSQYDLTNPNYAITKENALTLQGKIKLAAE